MRKVRSLIKFWLPVVFWAGLIFLLSSRPSPPPTGSFFFDIIVPYLAHLALYFILFGLLFRASKNHWLSYLLSAFYALSDEYHQSFVPTRNPSWTDVLVDLFGILLAGFLIWRLLPKAPEKLKNWAKKWGGI